jgi:hypothetical protein
MSSFEWASPIGSVQHCDYLYGVKTKWLWKDETKCFIVSQFLARYYQDHAEEDEKGWACSTHEGKYYCMHRFGRNISRKDTFGKTRRVCKDIIKMNIK